MYKTVLLITTVIPNNDLLLMTPTTLYLPWNTMLATNWYQFKPEATGRIVLTFMVINICLMV